MSFGNTKRGIKLIGTYVLVCAIGVIVSGIGLYNVGMINANGGRGYRFNLVGLNLAKAANAVVLKVGRSLSDSFPASSPEQQASFTTEVEKDLASMARGNLDKAEPLLHTKNGKEAFPDFNQSWLDYAQAFKEMNCRTNAAPLQSCGDLTGYLFGDFSQKTNWTDEPMSTLVDVK